MKLASGHTYEEMDPAVKEEYRKDITGALNDVIFLQPGGWVFPRRYLKYQQALYNFKVTFIHDQKGLMYFIAQLPSRIQ